MSETEASLYGSCICKNCSFKVPVESVRFGFASCHCSVCRISHASPFVLWSGLNAEHSEDFQLLMDQELLTGFRSSDICSRYFCKTCGTHLYLKYDDSVNGRWTGEIHFPTAILNEESITILEKVNIIKM